MRIAYVCADLGIPVFGTKGCSIHVQEVIRALRDQGATVELFAASCKGTPPTDLADLSVHALPFEQKASQAEREQQAIALNGHLHSALAKSAPFDMVYERYSLWSCSAMEFAQREGIPGLLEVNAPLIEEQAQYRQLVHEDQAEHLSARAFLSAQSIIAVSRSVKNYLSHWISPTKVHVIPNGVNHHRFSQQTSRALRPVSKADSFAGRFTGRFTGSFTVGFVGSLKPWHGLSHLVNAFAHLHGRVPQARLLIVGDGPQREEITTALARHNLQSFTHFTGAVSPAEIPALLAQMDAAVAPYPGDVDFYFSPLKVFEYMAAGLPVVVSELGQLATLIENDKTGLLCLPGHDLEIANALERLWRSPDLRRRLGQAARQQVLAHHTWDGVAKQILAIAHPKKHANPKKTSDTVASTTVPSTQANTWIEIPVSRRA